MKEEILRYIEKLVIYIKNQIFIFFHYFPISKITKILFELTVYLKNDADNPSLLTVRDKQFLKKIIPSLKIYSEKNNRYFTENYFEKLNLTISLHRSNENFDKLVSLHKKIKEEVLYLEQKYLIIKFILYFQQLWRKLK